MTPAPRSSTAHTKPVPSKMGTSDPPSISIRAQSMPQASRHDSSASGDRTLLARIEGGLRWAKGDGETRARGKLRAQALQTPGACASDQAPTRGVHSLSAGPLSMHAPLSSALQGDVVWGQGPSDRDVGWDPRLVVPSGLDLRRCVGGAAGRTSRARTHASIRPGQGRRGWPFAATHLFVGQAGIVQPRFLGEQVVEAAAALFRVLCGSGSILRVGGGWTAPDHAFRTAAPRG